MKSQISAATVKRRASYPSPCLAPTRSPPRSTARASLLSLPRVPYGWPPPLSLLRRCVGRSSFSLLTLIFYRFPVGARFSAGVFHVNTEIRDQENNSNSHRRETTCPTCFAQPRTVIRVFFATLVSLSLPATDPHASL